MKRYLVETSLHHGIYSCDEPEVAVRVFHREFEVPENTVVQVFVLDPVGGFKRESVVTRVPNPIPTKPDSPYAKEAESVTPASRRSRGFAPVPEGL